MFFRFEPETPLLSLIPSKHFFAKIFPDYILIFKKTFRNNKIHKIIEKEGKFTNFVETRSNLIFYGPKILIRQDLQNKKTIEYEVPEGFQILDLAVSGKYKYFLAVTKRIKTQRSFLFFWQWDKIKNIYQYENKKILTRALNLDDHRTLVYGKYEVKIIDNRRAKVVKNITIDSGISNIKVYEKDVYLVTLLNKKIVLWDSNSGKKDNFEAPKNGAMHIYFGSKVGCFEITDLEHVHKIF